MSHASLTQLQQPATGTVPVDCERLVQAMGDAVVVSDAGGRIILWPGAL